jgi:hypothetical protein
MGVVFYLIIGVVSCLRIGVGFSVEFRRTVKDFFGIFCNFVAAEMVLPSEFLNRDRPTPRAHPILRTIRPQEESRLSIHGRFLRLKDFCCKTVQFPRNATQADFPKSLASARMRKLVKTDVKSV